MRRGGYDRAPEHVSVCVCECMCVPGSSINMWVRISIIFFLQCLLLHSKIRTLSGLGLSRPLLFPRVAEGELMGPAHTEAHTALKTEAHSSQDTAAPLSQAGRSSHTHEGRRAPSHTPPCPRAHTKSHTRALLTLHHHLWALLGS